MSDELKSIQNYLYTIDKKLALGDATEHTHHSALETMVESLAEGITATNEPKHIECGAPDFILRKGSVTVGYIEAKDIGKSLDEVEFLVHAVVRHSKRSIELRDRAATCHASQMEGGPRRAGVLGIINRLRGQRDLYMRGYPPVTDRRRESDLFEGVR